MNERTSLRWIAVITAEKVDEARRDLCLQETATFAKVKIAYRELAKIWHPDVCKEEDVTHCQERFRCIANAKNLLTKLIRHYRYSLRREDIERDQESYIIKFLRVYGNSYSRDSTIANDQVKRLSSPNRKLITAENILCACEILGLSDFASKVQIESAHGSRKIRQSVGSASVAMEQLEWAYNLLTRYIKGYNYSFRPDDIREYQEDAIERHRRQFGNEPFWAGGIYDEPDV